MNPKQSGRPDLEDGEKYEVLPSPLVLLVTFGVFWIAILAGSLAVAVWVTGGVPI